MIEKLVEALKIDKDLYYSYQANIAMAFYDEYRRTGNNLSYEKVHEVANQAAKNFLNLLTGIVTTTRIITEDLPQTSEMKIGHAEKARKGMDEEKP